MQNTPVAVYAGTFDPPTLAHLYNVYSLVKKGYRVWMVPIISPPPHKPNKINILNIYDMCKLGVEDYIKEKDILQYVEILDIGLDKVMSACGLMYSLTKKFPNLNLNFVNLIKL